MATVPVYDMNGTKVSETELNDAVFGITPNEAVMHAAVVNYLANQRQGTQSTLTRTEVSGGGKKPYRQKGTGRARQGSTRAPQFRGGGIVFGPTPRSYRYKINRKVARLALKSYLSTFASEGTLKVVDKFELEEIKTKQFVQIMKDLGLTRKVLFVFDEDEDWENAWMSMRNLPEANFEFAESVSCLELANTYTLVCTEAAVNKIQEGLK